MNVPRYTREIPQRYRLEAGKCEKCGFLAIPPRLICPDCGSQKFQTVNLSSEGKIVTYTIIHVGPDAFTTQTPYAVGIIETDDGARLTCQIVDCKPDEIEIDKKVKLVFRNIQKEGHAGILQYGYKAVLQR